ncbi:MAG: hypothetical protein KDA45_00575, partial [Planctomycetales bacterium]|nr:hypothetical protein [Planctomycetales bacterium]
GMFAGLSANPGGVGAHISDNGLASFGDTYARHFAITPEKIPAVAPDAGPAEVDAGWAVAGFVFDNERNQIAAYLNGVSSEFWSDADQFYRSAATAWKQAQLAKTPGLQPGERPDFPADQYYNPPQTELQSEEVVSESAEERVVVRTYAFTKVGVTYRKDAQGKFTLVGDTQLLAIKANPYWFNHDIYAPPSATEGGPFTIGRVIHSNRSSTLAAHIGGVAVYNRALSAAEMQTLAAIGRSPEGEASGEDAVLKLSELNAPRANP